MKTEDPSQSTPSPAPAEGAPLAARGASGAPVPAVGVRRPRRMTGALGLPVMTGVVIFGVLEGIHRVELIPRILFPSPISVFDSMLTQVQQGYFWSNMFITLQEAILGFFIGSAIGLCLGIGIGISSLISKALYPYIVLIQSMPRVALAPVFIAVLGFGMTAKVVTAVAICFFPVMINTVVGLRQIDEEAHDLMRSMVATELQIFRKLRLPSALPVIFGGLQTSLTLAFVGAIVGELEAANAGVSLIIESAAYQLRMEAVFAALTWLALMALAMFGLMGWLDRRIVFWRETKLD